MKKRNDPAYLPFAGNLSKNFQLELSENQPLSESSLHELLRKAIDQLIDSDLNQLLIILYRLDINEQKVREILSSAPPGQIAKKLAETIIEREKQKVITRKKYRE